MIGCGVFVVGAARRRCARDRDRAHRREGDSGCRRGAGDAGVDRGPRLAHAPPNVRMAGTSARGIVYASAFGIARSSAECLPTTCHGGPSSGASWLS